MACHMQNLYLAGTLTHNAPKESEVIREVPIFGKIDIENDSTVWVKSYENEIDGDSTSNDYYKSFS